jgi:hypothetical protein
MARLDDHRLHVPPVAARMVEDIVGCKWSLYVLDLISRGVNRPGEMQRSYHGVTTKVLNERLRKLTKFGVLERHAYAEVPPRPAPDVDGAGLRVRADAVRRRSFGRVTPPPAALHNPGGMSSWRAVSGMFASLPRSKREQA